MTSHKEAMTASLLQSGVILPVITGNKTKIKKHCFLKIYYVFLARYKYNFLFYLLLRQDIKFTKHTTWCDI